MLRPDVPQTIGLADASLRRAQGDEAAIDRRAPELHLESLGISAEEKHLLVELARSGAGPVDAVASFLVGATSGHSYKDLIGRLTTYPVPNLRLGPAPGAAFLDLGASWGRWSIAAARRGFDVVGLDPSLGASLAARRIARQLGLEIKHVCGDARFLPFAPQRFHTVFSYSVLQHLAKTEVRVVLSEVGRVLRSDGQSLVQMPNALGIRCLQHQMRRGFRPGRGFEVRYWTPPELLRTFEDRIGPSRLSVDCYFGLGLQDSDRDLMGPATRAIMSVSDLLRAASRWLPGIKYLADSVYVHSDRQG